MVEAKLEDPIGQFAEFFKSFLDGKGSFKYRERVRQMVVLGSKSLTVDFDDLLLFDVNLAKGIVDRPREYLEYASLALYEVVKTEYKDYAEKIGRFHARFRGAGDVVPIRKIRAEHINKMITIEGVLVRSSSIKQRLVESTFICKNVDCREVIRIPQVSRSFTTPSICPKCGRKGTLEFSPENSSYIDAQIFIVQEKPEELPPGQLPRSIEVLVTEDLVDSARPGDRILISGIVTLKQESSLKLGKLTTFTTYLEANYVEVSTKGYEDVEITPEDEREIREVAKDPDIVDKIVRSIAPSIYGMEEVKEAIAYMLFGGVPKVMPDGIKVRGDLHVLIIGDPGTAKSQLLQYVAKLAPRGIYTSGKGSTAAGLTATVIRDKNTGEFFLEAGALVLADNGVSCIDEIDKMRQDDRVAIHEAMEQQTVSIAKAGIVATLNARTSILAAANPTLGRYMSNRPLSENINLPVTILSRFDFIFIITDKPSKVRDAALADHVLNLRAMKSEKTTPFPPDFLRKYIAYARRNVMPKLTEAAIDRIKSYFLGLREKASEDSPVPITVRQLETLVRAAEARARIALRSEVTAEDAEAVIELMDYYLRTVGSDAAGRPDIDIIMTGKPRTVQQKIAKIIEILGELQKELQGGPVSKELIIERAQQEGIDKTFVEKTLRQLLGDGVIFQPRDGYYKKV
ncbi:MAG: minichromosome maintenance protein MCM [Candidatus Nezhaarchaeota archaeon]|nr:minichromosome maintenance protein MCM [Candidatus Nezhaarchaeota archaeon]MCX8142080.1 minichromosome maintenance protein MCM [Candidatus Nezhaarchaeota archaeon]MDW8050139.1 minichromosome maintenance protein MCM [Nitrososphaerota archaeon]